MWHNSTNIIYRLRNERKVNSIRNERGGQQTDFKERIDKIGLDVPFQANFSSILIL
jgi:hypothetical protein